MPSPTSRSHQAAHAVLFTNELLCNIVARLPLPDILAASRICKFVRDALKDDPSIKKALFLKPAQVREVLVSNFILEWNDLTLDDSSVIGKVNPFVKGIVGRVQLETQRGNDHPLVTRKHPNGVWREMFITQPPCKKVFVTIHEHGSDKEVSVRLSSETTVNFGDLYDFLHLGTFNDIFDDTPKCETFVTIPNYVDQEDLWGYEGHSTRCEFRDGRICVPAPSSSDLSDSGSEDSETDDQPGLPYGMADLEDYESDDETHPLYTGYKYHESEDDGTEDSDDLDEYDADEAGEIDQFYRR